MSQDYIALEWVKGEINETLQQAQQALETYVENPQDKSQLKFCLSYLHQVHGTLQMVEFYGAALLAEEMEAVASALSAKEVLSEQDALEILIQAILQLPNYLEHVKVGRRDLPIVLLPILNDLRAARGENLLSESALFTPSITPNEALNSAQLAEFSGDDFQQWARKLRQMLQAAMLQLLQNKQPDVAKQYLSKVFVRLHKTIGHTPSGLVWLPALAFSEWLQKQSNPPKSAKMLLRQLDGQLKRLLDGGASALNQPVNIDLLKNILFYLVHSDARSDAIRQVQQQFGLQQALPSEEELAQEREALAGPDRSTVMLVLGALIEEIIGLKDRLDLLVRSDEDRLATLSELSGNFKRLSDTMGMLGLGMPRQVMQDQILALQQVLGREQASDEDILDLAGALLYVEATLSGMQKAGDLNSRANESALSDAQKAVLNEARNVLEQVKDAVVCYIANHWSVAELDNVPASLSSVKGSMSMIPLPRVASILDGASQFVQQQLIDAGIKPQWAVLDTFADVLSGVEYFIERYSDNPNLASETLLERAEEALNRLPSPDAAAQMMTEPEPLPNKLGDAKFDDFNGLSDEDLAALDDIMLSEDDSHLLNPITNFNDLQEQGYDDGDIEQDDQATGIEFEPFSIQEQPNSLELEALLDQESASGSDLEPSLLDEVVLDEVAVDDVPVAPVIELSPIAPPQSQPVKQPASAPAQEGDDDDLIDEEIIEIFLEEAQEVTDTLKEFWPQYLTDQDDSESLTTVRRAWHTLKGSGRMVKALVIGELAWSIENMFNRVLDNTISISPELIDLVNYSIAHLPPLIDDFRERRSPSLNTQPLMDYANALATGQSVAPFSTVVPEAEAVRNDAVEEIALEEISLEGVEAEDSVEEAFDSASLIDAAQAESSEHSIEAASDEDAIEWLPLSDETDANNETVQDLPELSVDLSEDAALVEPSDDDDFALLEVFDGEARGHLSTVNEFIVESRENFYAGSLSDGVQRALHTLKGSAHMAALTGIAHVAAPLEKLVKELRSYQVANSSDIVNALEQGAQMIEGALNDRNLLQREQLPGTPAYLAELEALEERLLSALREQNSDVLGPNPQAISRFLANGMDSLLAADDLLHQWEQERDVSVLNELRRDLFDVSGGAAEAGVPHIQLLAEALNDLYERIQVELCEPDIELKALLAEAHEEILNMMDCLAVGQETQRPEDLLERIRTCELPLNNAMMVSQSPAQDSEPEVAFDEDIHFDLPVIEEDEPESAAEVVAQDSTEAAVPLQVDDEEILEIFLEEAQEISETVETILQRWRASPENLLLVAQLQRELHTLKGGARMAELNAVADLCHELETLYERINDGRLGVQPALFDVLDQAHDALDSQIVTVRSGFQPPAANAMITRLKNYVRGVRDEADVVEEALELNETVHDEPSAPVAPAAPLNMSPTLQDEVHSEALDESDREILEIFLEEAHELQEVLERALHDWEQAPNERSHSDEIQRVMHTLKGGARLAGLTHLGNASHDFETLVVKAQQGQVQMDAEFFRHVHRRQDELTAQIEQVENALSGNGMVVLGESQLVIEPMTLEGEVLSSTEAEHASNDDNSLEPVNGDESADELAQADASTSNVVPLRPAAMAPSAKADKAIGAKPQQNTVRKAPQELVKVPADLLDSLVNLAGETSIGRGRVEQQVTDFSHTLEEMEMTLDRLRDQLRRLDMETEAQVVFRQERQGPMYEDFDPLEMDRYSTLQQLSRSLMESASDLFDLKETLSHKTRDTETLLLQQSRVNTELQEGLMKTRMVPFQRLVPRLRRIVRQISLELDKQVELRVFNADGEMDRSILERMISPLEHMVRNAVDHGLEKPAERVAAGKAEVGFIDLDISREGGDVVLTLSDDGRGINIQAVRRKAVQSGLIEENARISDEEVMQFILHAGFSTAEAITQISGRGVGMDVVHSEIKQLGGSVEIQSKAGVGTRFIVRLPFTVSVNRALMVRMGEDLYAVPLNNIQGIVRAPVAQLQSLYELPQNERLYEYAGVDYRIEYLGNLLEQDALPKLSGQSMPLPLLLVRGSVPFALQVDALLGSREIVVKTLGPQFGSVKGVSGGTILGDGSVVIILDLPAMIRMQASLEYQQARALDHQAAERRNELEQRLPRIMVVDDSVTVRKVTTRLLERHGMEVITAKDGVDAIAVLQEHMPDLMLLDIEMPRMDGFELASHMRHDSRLKNIPIIMITSRTGDKHRERAMAIGVNEYMGKPFQEDVLLDAMGRLLNREVVH